MEENKLFVDNLGKLLEERLNNIESKYNLRLESLNKDLMQLKEAISKEKDEKILEEYKADMNKVQKEIEDSSDKIEKEKQDLSNDINFDIVLFKQEIAAIDNNNSKLDDLKIRKESLDNDLKQLNDAISNEKDPKIVEEFNKDRDKVLAELVKVKRSNRYYEDQVNKHNNNIMEIHEKYDALIEKYNVKENDNNINSEEIDNDNNIKSEEIDNDSNVISKNIKYNQDKENVINIGSKILDEMSKDYTHLRIEKADINGNSVDQSEDRIEDDSVKTDTNGN